MNKGYGLVSVVDFTSSSLDGRSLGDVIDHEVRKVIGNRPIYGIEDKQRNLENYLNASLSSLLKFNDEGKRTYIVSKNRPMQKLTPVLVAINSIMLFS